MSVATNIPGYITLSEAEEKYKIKADTLKKRCQRGEIIGAKKMGKTWLVPNIPGIDPDKTIPENYPGLNFDSAYTSNASLYDAESDCRLALYTKHKKAVYIWEYGFYFFSLVISNSSVHRSYLPLAALITEAHSALRCAFLLNLNGYHPDAFALLRKTHECVIKVLACKTQPKKMWSIGFDTGRGKAEHIIGVDFKKVWTLESSFTHSNLMKLFEAGKDLQDSSKEIGVSYGPQLNNQQFGAVINTSVFWLFVLIESMPYIFPGQIRDNWISQKDQSAKLLKDYLTSVKALSGEVVSFEKAIEKLLATSVDQNHTIQDQTAQS
jgi:hypothetical protein